MKRFLISIFILGCDAKGSSFMKTQDMSDDQYKKDSAIDAADLNTDTNFFPAYKDPYRKSKEICQDDFDCARGSYCDRGELSSCNPAVQGCGVGAINIGFEEDGCAIINEHGLGQFTHTDCKTDSDCHPDFPHCYLKACQNITACKIDKDCQVGQFCYFETFCVTPKTSCEKDDDCPLAKCKNRTCVYERN